jgi:hypothetical protein
MPKGVYTRTAKARSVPPFKQMPVLAKRYGANGAQPKGLKAPEVTLEQISDKAVAELMLDQAMDHLFYGYRHLYIVHSVLLKRPLTTLEKLRLKTLRDNLETME